MKAFFKELFEYSTHFNQKLILLLNEQGNKAPEKSVKLMSHVVHAHHIWNSRITNKKPLVAVWETKPLAELKKLDAENFANTLAILNSRGFDEIITYTNTQGNSYPNTIRDILFHVVNHSTYHRAQIASDLKQHGIEPLVTDYIAYKR